MDDFIRWFIENGGALHPSAEVVTGDEGHHVRVRTGCTVAAGDPLVSCPHPLILSFANARDDEIWTKNYDTDRMNLTEIVALRLFLMKQYLLQEDSFWWPYIKTLPQPFQTDAFDTPLYFDQADMLWLNGTNLGCAARLRAKAWEDEFDRVHNVAENFYKGKPNLRANDPIMSNRDHRSFSSDLYRYNSILYMWAATIITSRCFPSSALPEVVIDSPVLIPGVDLLNHSPSVEVTWNFDTSKCAIQTEVPFGGGDQILNNYGSMKGNEELLMGYGFCLPSNNADSFNLSYSPATSCYIRAAKHQRDGVGAKLDARPSFKSKNDSREKVLSTPRTEGTPSEDIKLVRFTDGDAQFSSGFLADYALALENRREQRQTTTCNRNDTNFSKLNLSRNKLHTLSTIIMILQKKRADIRQHDQQLPPFARNKKQKYALMYRSSQLTILDGVLASLSDVLGYLTGLKSSVNVQNLRIIRLQDMLKTKPSRLLTTNFREVIHAGLGTRNVKKIIDRGGEDFAFAVWVCGLRLLQRKEQIDIRETGKAGDSYLSDAEPVLYQWMNFLADQYDNEDYVVEWMNAENERASRPSGDSLSDPSNPPASTPAEVVNIGSENGPASRSIDESLGNDQSRSATKTNQVLETTTSYVQAIQAAIKAHPDSVYDDPWALDAFNLTWCLMVVKEEGVRCPTLTEQGEIAGEDEDEFVLVLDGV